MKTKTIKKELSNVYSKWIESIDNKELTVLIRENIIITGGCIASMLLGEEVNDYDIYFATAQTVAKVSEYYLKKAQEIDKTLEAARIHYFDDEGILCSMDNFISSKQGRLKIFIEGRGYVSFNGKNRKKYEPIFISSNAIMLKGKIQIVLRFWGSPADIHKNYDFVHCMSYWTPKELVIPTNTAICLLTRELKYQGSRYPLTSIIRTRKFVRRGWKITAGEYLKMAAQLQEINLFDPSVLEDQLMGVDISYFLELIHNMKKAIKDSNVEINSTYIIDLVDKIFNDEHDD